MIGGKAPLLILFCLLGFVHTALAHRLDEYLQATTLGLERHQITLHLRLTPGMDVATSVLHQIDQNNNGQLSPTEQQTYVARIAQGLALLANGRAVPLSVKTMTFPATSAIQNGMGVIDLVLTAPIDLHMGQYTLIYHNPGAGPQTAWLVNALVPEDPAIHILRQTRSRDQSRYELRFAVRA